MSRGRDTSTIRIDRKVLTEILQNVDQPEILSQIFLMAAGLPLRRNTVEEFERLCNDAPCILWRPEDVTKRHVTVHITRQTDRTMVHVCRVVWRIVHTVPELGPMDLRSHEEVLHNCLSMQEKNTAFGACLNPAHMVRGTSESRTELKVFRALARKIGMRSVAVPTKKERS